MSISNDKILTNLPILDSNSYDKWYKQMKVLFGYQDVLDMITDGITPLGEEATTAQQAKFKEDKKKDYKALFLIHSCVDSDNFEKVGDCDSAKTAWGILEKAYAGADKANVVRLQTHKRQFELLQMEDKETINDYVTRVTRLGNQMKSCGEAVSEQNFVSKNFDGKESQNSRKGEGSSKGGGQDNYKRFDESTKKCYNCQKLGHFARECRAKPRENHADEAKVARQDVDYDNTVLVMIMEENYDIKEVLDSNYDKRKLLDSNYCSAEKSAKTHSEKSAMVTVRDGAQGRNEWYLDSGIKCNLLSIGQLLERNYMIRMENKVLRVLDQNGVLILKAPMAANRTFKIESKIMEHRCLTTAASRDEWLWHYRLGHLNFRDLNALQKYEMVTGLPSINS
ncbi:uncharacterized protein [Cicer arietinum]|uniref:Uncharacterized protein LOC105852819 n=1 Tax=Cicer arietinum TaxID=3827 RepID=A0A1S3EGN8_CICAR|nr:uncharacterized protein LOC105852819 [Cicer arietinum]